MLKSVLLYLESAEQASPVIDFGVALAKKTDARVRGLTLVDTRRFDDAQSSESAVYLSMAQSCQAVTETIQERAREKLSRACLKAKLNFDVRRIFGNPLEVLPAESRYHDLVIISPDKINRRLAPGLAQVGLSAADMSHLLTRGVQPLVVLPSRARTIERVLLVYDGTEASSRTIRSYLGLGVLQSAEHRLLAVGRSELEARTALAEMAEYCTTYLPSIEMGWAAGKLRDVVTSYAEKWEADMLVIAADTKRSWMKRLVGKVSLQMAKALKCAIFVHA